MSVCLGRFVYVVGYVLPSLSTRLPGTRLTGTEKCTFCTVGPRMLFDRLFWVNRIVDAVSLVDMGLQPFIIVEVETPESTFYVRDKVPPKK